jgi:hypothetical protein
VVAVSFSGGTITAAGYAATVQLGGTLTIQDNADIQAAQGGVIVLGQNDDTKARTTLTMTGGSIQAEDGYAISGNGTDDYTTITISGGTITSDEGVGIYHPQVGDLTITGNTAISGNISGVQYSGAGKLIIGDSESSDIPTITATYEYTPFPQKSSTQGDGTVKDGAALSIISRGGGYQDANNKMTVIINNATLNSENNAAISIYRLAKVDGEWKSNGESGVETSYLDSLTITGGTFTGASSKGALEVDSLASDAIAIKGGTFSSDPGAYVPTEGYMATENDEDSTWTVTSTSGSSTIVGGGVIHKDEDEDGLCDDCGQIIGAYLKGRSLTLEGTIAVNYYVALDDNLQNDNTKMQFTVNGETTLVAFDKDQYATINGTTCYRFTVKVTAKQMTDEIQAQLQVTQDDGQILASAPIEGTVDYTYSVATYGKNMQNENIYVKQLVTALLNYGTMAQNYFEYNSDASANDVLDGNIQEMTVTAEQLEGYAIEKDGTTDGIAYVGATLVLESETSVRFYFKLDEGASISDYTFQAVNKDTDATVKLAGPAKGTGALAGYYFVQVSNIVAQRLDYRYTVTVTKNGDAGESTGNITVTYGPLTYAYNQLSSESSTVAMKNLVQALYHYNQAAKTYFANVQ